MIDTNETLPQVQLNRWELLRMVAVGIIVAFMLIRVVPDAIRLIYPIGQYNYVTDDNGVVVKLSGKAPKGTDALRLGDRVRIDRIQPFDRKPGLARTGYTEQNFDRWLPIERNGKERVLHLKSTREPMASQALTLLRIILYGVAVGFGALLLIVNPTLATFAFFVFCLGGAEPTTFTDGLFWVPWRAILRALGDFISGQAPLALLLFGVCLAIGDKRARIIIAGVLGVAAFTMGALNALDFWRLTYQAMPAQDLRHAYEVAEIVADVLTGFAFVVAFARTRGAERHRTGWIIAAFVAAALGRVASENLNLNIWQNGTLLSLWIAPVIVVWIAVVKDHFFDVDFVVSRALVYIAVTAAVLFVLGSFEEVLGYNLYMNANVPIFNDQNLSYPAIMACGLIIGSTFGKVTAFLRHLVDRFIFRERLAQRTSLERVAANLLGAEDAATVYSMLLHDVPSILDLSFSGIMMRTADGGYTLAHEWNWPPECVSSLSPDHPFTREISKSRGLLPEDAVGTTMVKALFPNERLTYAAPLYFERVVSALVFYGHSVTGLDIDPEERVTLARVMANASLALNAIELTAYRRTYGAIALNP